LKSETEIKIELPGNVKVSCPTAHTAITILRCVSFRAEQAAAAVNGLPQSAKNLRDVTPLGWQTYGSGLDGRGDGWVSAADADSSHEADDFSSGSEGTEYTVADAEYEEDVVAAQVINDEGDDFPDVRVATDAGSGFPHVPYEGPDDIEDVQQVLPGLEQEPTSLEEDEDLEDFGGERSSYVMPSRQNTRSRMSASLFERISEEEDDESEHGRQIYQPMANRLGDVSKAVFDFIQGRLVFSTMDVRIHGATDLGLKLNKKNKKKLRKALKVIERAGLIEKTAKGEWRKTG